MSTEKTTAAGWKKAAVHSVLLPSGTRIDMKIVDLPAMVETGQIPQHLLDVAIDVAVEEEARKPSVEMMKLQREYTDLLVLASVVNPKVTEADLPEIPYEDKDLIVAIATRQRDFDAEGAHIGGLDKSEKFRKFRGFTDFEPTVEGS